jgi:hypothetical protein
MRHQISPTTSTHLRLSFPNKPHFNTPQNSCNYCTISNPSLDTNGKCFVAHTIIANEVIHQHRLFFLEENPRPRRRTPPQRKPQIRHDPRQPESQAAQTRAQRFQIDSRAQHTPHDIGHGRRRVSSLPTPHSYMSTNTNDRLNLTIASRIYLLEPQWNPFLELQAIARAQRIGQTKQVECIRYVMKGTIEQVRSTEHILAHGDLRVVLERCFEPAETKDGARGWWFQTAEDACLGGKFGHARGWVWCADFHYSNISRLV